MITVHAKACWEQMNTVKILLEARTFIRIITFDRDGGGPLLEATRLRKVI